MTATIKLSTPEEIAARAGAEPPFLRLPERGLFAERELRLRQLAAGHAMRDYLMLVAEIAHGQHALLERFGPVALPESETLDAAAAKGVAPLPADTWPRDPAWRDGFRSLLQRLLPRLSGSPAAQALAPLADKDDAWLEQQADRLLECVVPPGAARRPPAGAGSELGAARRSEPGVMLGLDLGAAPLVAAALQAYWTHLVLAVQREHAASKPFGRIDDATVCPCCASRPTASITRIGDVQGQRYLHCALCGTQWHCVRIQCSHCGSNKHIHFQALEPLAGHAAPVTGPAPGAVQAECCDDCDHYLKIVHMEKDPQVEPVADDLASLTLDLLVSESGKQRHGVNLMLLFGPDDDGGG